MPLDNGIAEKLELDGLGDYSYTDALAGTPPVIVIGEILPKPDAMLAVIPESGPPPDRILGRFPRYQVVSRDLDYLTAQARAEAVHQSLDQHQGSLDGILVARIQPDSEPIYSGRDGTGIAGSRHEFTQTFTVISR